MIMRIKVKGWDGITSFIIILIPWLIGIVLAKGFWSTFFALIIPFYAWYLVIERVLHYYGIF